MIEIIPSLSVVFCEHTTWTWCITVLFSLFCRIEHEKLHAKHKGHEAMHMEMILILFSTLIVAQVLLVKWKKHYYKSFQVKKNSNCQAIKPWTLWLVIHVTQWQSRHISSVHVFISLWVKLNLNKFSFKLKWNKTLYTTVNINLKAW